MTSVHHLRFSAVRASRTGWASVTNTAWWYSLLVVWMAEDVAWSACRSWSVLSVQYGWSSAHSGHQSSQGISKLVHLTQLVTLICLCVDQCTHMSSWHFCSVKAFMKAHRLDSSILGVSGTDAENTVVQVESFELTSVNHGRGRHSVRGSVFDGRWPVCSRPSFLKCQEDEAASFKLRRIAVPPLSRFEVLPFLTLKLLCLNHHLSVSTFLWGLDACDLLHVLFIGVAGPMAQVINFSDKSWSGLLKACNVVHHRTTSFRLV